MIFLAVLVLALALPLVLRILRALFLLHLWAVVLFLPAGLLLRFGGHPAGRLEHPPPVGSPRRRAAGARAGGALRPAPPRAPGVTRSGRRACRSTAPGTPGEKARDGPQRLVTHDPEVPMRCAALDLDARLPAAAPDSSRAYGYGLGAHLAATRAEAAKHGPTTAAPRPCGRTDYLHGFTVRRELRRRGLLATPGQRARRRAAALAA
ncbi:MAG TPA: hypothetical protein VF746_14685 [Longimicrobium sp.]